MSNDDLISALLFVDDVTLENGPLEVVPGTHKGPLYSLWHDGVFTGAVADEVFEQHKHNIVKCTGKAGSVCLMLGCAHGIVVHEDSTITEIKQGPYDGTTDKVWLDEVHG